MYNIIPNHRIGCDFKTFQLHSKKESERERKREQFNCDSALIG